MRWLLAMLAFLLGAPGVMGQDAPVSDRALAEAGVEAYSAAVARLETDDDPTVAFGLLDSAIASWSALRERGADNADLHRNLGNAHFERGHLGRAIASYRRALRVRPSDAAAGESLRAASSAAGVPPWNGASDAERALLWWRGLVPRWALLSAAGGAWAVVWLSRLLPRRLRERARPAVVIAGIAGVFGAVSLLAEPVVDRFDRAGVVVDEPAAAFKGPSAVVYEPAFNEALPVGREVRVVREQDGWSLVRLSDGRSCWVASEKLEMVR